MAEVRHISYRAEDVDAMAKFFVDAMDMTVVQKRKDNSIDLSDGSVNIAIFPLAANRSRRVVSTILVFLQRTVRNRFGGWKRPARRKRVRGRLTKKSLKVLRALLSMSAVGQARHLWKNRIVLRLSVKENGTNPMVERAA